MPTNLPCQLSAEKSLIEILLSEPSLRPCVLEIAKGIRIIQEGSDCGGIHILKSGSVELWLESDSKRFHIGKLESGTIVGLEPCLHHKPYPYSAVTAIDSKLIFIKKSHLSEYLNSHHTICPKVLAAIGQNQISIMQMAANSRLRSHQS